MNKFFRRSNTMQQENSQNLKVMQLADEDKTAEKPKHPLKTFFRHGTLNLKNKFSKPNSPIQT